ncbi:MAG: L-aspartate oxidase, partial [Chloroflexota bacterium]
DATGAEIEQALTRRVARAGADLFQHTLLLDLVIEDGRCVGCDVLDLRSGGRQTIRATHTVLATGGGGQLFSHTTNPSVATADGVAAALRAGAAVADLEFFQFHPTALMKTGAPRFLISEATRGDGAILKNARGERFMPKYDDRGELAPRDVVARAIVRELDDTGAPHVLLDLTHLEPERVESHFPTISRVCRRYGIEITREPIPVAPAAHYMIGGVLTDAWGRTTLPGLYVCGEAASAGVHGANRLASNSLLEAVVFGRRIVEVSCDAAAGSQVMVSDPPIELSDVDPRPARRVGGVSAPRLREALWRHVGITRAGASLAGVEEQLAGWLSGYAPKATRRSVELANMLLVGWLMARAALRREESRGAHYRADFSATRPEWRKRMAVRLRGYPRLTL